MKKVLTALLASMLALGASANQLVQNTQEIAVSGLVDFQTINNHYVNGDVMYGIFILDGLEVGGRARYQTDDTFRMWQLGAVAEYNFDLSPYGMIPEIVPFVGGSLSFAGISYDYSTTEYVTVIENGSIRTQPQTVSYDDSENGLVFGLEAGVKYFIVPESFALSASVQQDLATGDIYFSDDGLKKTDTRLQLGLRFFY